MIKKILAALACVALSVSVACAQTQAEAKAKENTPPNMIEAKRAEMKKIDRFVGRWGGSGWIRQGKTRENFVGTEDVRRKIDGLALLVEGNYKNKAGKIIHETLAVLTPNLKTKNFDFQTYLANGISGLYELKTSGTGWQWGFSFPGGAMRYNIKIESDVWTEIGEMSRDDGKTWTRFFEMNLKKIE
jgi:hypothetical protein